MDIISIHQHIVQLFLEKQEMVDTYQLQLEQMKELVVSDKTSERAKTILDEKIKELDIKIIDIRSKVKFNQYMFFAVPLIEKYRRFLITPLKLSFMSSAASKKPSTVEKNLVINEYIEKLHKLKLNFTPVISVSEIDEIIKAWTNLDTDEEPVNEQATPLSCSGCGSTGNNFDIDGNIYTCVVCGTQIDLITATSCFKDIERVNITSKYVYDRRSHFKEMLNQFQAKQTQVVPDAVFEQLIAQLELHTLVDGDETINPQIRFSRVTKEHIVMFLKELGLTKYYEDTVYIYKRLTGKPTDDLSHIENKLLEDFDALLEVYDKKYKNQEGPSKRKNFINIQAILFHLLRRHGYPCKRSNFQILKTIDKKHVHDEIISDLFHTLKWNFSPLF